MAQLNAISGAPGPWASSLQSGWSARRVAEHFGVHQLRNILTEEWNAIDQARITRLINSIRRRCVACIDARGGYTRY